MGDCGFKGNIKRQTKTISILIPKAEAAKNK
jgi:hypothetical protein